MGLTIQQTRFVVAYCQLLGDDGEKPTATQAALSAGCKPVSAAAMASQWLKNPKIIEAIAERCKEVAAAAGITVEAVLHRWWRIANADPNELVQVQRVACRHCHGIGHAYQWTPAEYQKAVARAAQQKQPAPMPEGGFGYRLDLAPVASCPECGGLGTENMHFNDTRKLSADAKLLYLGAERTKTGGLKINMRDQDAALNNIAKFLGMTIDRKQITGPDGGPVQVAATVNPALLSDDALAAFIAQNAPGMIIDNSTGQPVE